MDWGAGFEAVRPWLTTAFIGSILGIVVKLYIDKRRLELAEKTRDQDFQIQISADGRTNLQFIIDNLVRDIKAQRALHAECEATLAGTKTRMDALQGLYNGLRQQFVAFQMVTARAIPPGDRSPEIEAMLVALETTGSLESMASDSNQRPKQRRWPR